MNWSWIAWVKAWFADHIDRWSSFSLPKLPVLTTSCTKWTAMATKSWTSCSRHFTATETKRLRWVWNRKLAPPSQHISACHTMSCYRYYLQQDPRARSGITTVSCQDVICVIKHVQIRKRSCHVQIHGTFKWSYTVVPILRILSFCYSCANIIPL